MRDVNYLKWYIKSQVIPAARKRFNSWLLRPIVRKYYDIIYDNIADNQNNIFLEIKDIKYWYSRSPSKEFTFPGIIKGGDWSKKRVNFYEHVNRSEKIISIIQRYKEGKKWKETDLFKKKYNRYIELGLYKFDDLDDLQKHYEDKYDKMFFAIKKNGITPSNKNNKIEPIYVHIDQDGDFYYTVDATHRLGIILALDLKQIPVRIWMRHKKWQKIRESILSDHTRSVYFNRYKNHPDIKSELGLKL